MKTIDVDDLRKRAMRSMIGSAKLMFLLEELEQFLPSEEPPPKLSMSQQALITANASIAASEVTERHGTGVYDRVRKHRCAVCGKKFSKQGLGSHKRTHVVLTGGRERPIKACRYCKEPFSTAHWAGHERKCKKRPSNAEAGVRKVNAHTQPYLIAQMLSKSGAVMDGADIVAGLYAAGYHFKTPAPQASVYQAMRSLEHSGTVISHKSDDGMLLGWSINAESGKVTVSKKE